MFRRKTPTSGLTDSSSEGGKLLESVQSQPLAPEAAPHAPLSDKGPEMSTRMPPATPFKPEIPRRVVEIPAAPSRRPGAETDATVAAPATAAGPAGSARASATATDMRKLIVGRDISLSGEITSCDVLVVEGTVEAKLRDGRNIEIAESGLFRGSVEIDEADIAGRFEGDIAVRGRLRVRASGRIHGSIRYGELEVEAGGQLVGEIRVIGMESPKLAKTGGAADADSTIGTALRSSAE